MFCNVRGRESKLTLCLRGCCRGVGLSLLQVFAGDLKFIIMYQDLERIRCLETRMRKKPLQRKELSLDPEDPYSNSKEQSKLDEDPADRVPPNTPPKGASQPVEPAAPQLCQAEVADDSLHKKNRKITEFFGARSKKVTQSTNSEKLVIKPIDLRNHCSKQTKTSDSPKNPGDSRQEEINNLKERLKQKDEQFNTYRKKVKDMVINYSIENHLHQRNETRARIAANRIRLGEYIINKEGGKMTESWIDGNEIRGIKERLDNIAKRRDDLDKEKRNLKPRVEADIEKMDVIACQLLMLTKEEFTFKESLLKLEDQKSVHIKDFKRLYEEDNSKYGKANPTTGLTVWNKVGNNQLLCLLGKGGFSQVYKAFDTQELREVACKIHEFDMRWADDAKDNYIRHALRQNTVHKQLKHPHIVSLYNTVEIDRTSFMTVMEFCDGPDLSYYLRKYKCIPEKEAKLLLRQVLYAIKYMHQLQPQKVIHYDLKPQNIIFHNGMLKVTDFGLCKTMKNELNRMELTSQGVGTYWYLPPECFIPNASITTKVDIWSIGVIYYQMLFNQKPFGHNMSQLRILKENVILKSKDTPLQFPQRTQVSQESKDFIVACLRYKEEERMNADEALRHCLFEGK